MARSVASSEWLRAARAQWRPVQHQDPPGETEDQPPKDLRSRPLSAAEADAFAEAAQLEAARNAQGQRHKPLLPTDYSPADSKDFVANLRRLRLIARAYNSPELQAFLASWPARIEKELS
ncbi:DUF6545 domain-containing protein [Streptomyces mirabilis]|uniref:DUF6545 domain-containing protein n=1 Tax=Streptomyces mirabilis TaxID=68239 RepID=UPI0034080A30